MQKVKQYKIDTCLFDYRNNASITIKVNVLDFFFFKILLFTNLFVENLVNFGTFMNVTFNILKIIQDSTSKVLRND